MSSYKASTRGDPNPVSDSLDPRHTCCICYCSYNIITTAKPAEGLVQLPCGHMFGATCISKWYSTKNTCPLCRAELPENLSHDYCNTSSAEQDSPREIFALTFEYRFTLSAVPAFSWHGIAVDDPEPPPIHGATYIHGRTSGGFHAQATTSRKHRLDAAVSIRSKRPSRRFRSRRQLPHSGNRWSSAKEEDIWMTALEEENSLHGSPFTKPQSGHSSNMGIDNFMTMSDKQSTLPEYPTIVEVTQTSPLEDRRPELPSPISLYEATSIDSDFFGLVADHIEWMHEASEDRMSQARDIYDAYA